MKRTRGLIGESNARNILLRTRFGIHTLGVKFPIDVVILDKNGQVMKLRGGLKPNSFYFWPPQFDLILELPSGTIESKKMKLGQHIELMLHP